MANRMIITFNLFQINRKSIGIKELTLSSSQQFSFSFIFFSLNKLMNERTKVQFKREMKQLMTNENDAQQNYIFHCSRRFQIVC